MKERILFWDILKGIGIISIVLGHCCPPAAPYVYTYHLALFFFVSAYFYNEKKYINKPFDYVGNLFKNNWTKYVFYSVLLILIHNLGVKFAFSYGIAPYSSIAELVSAIASSLVFICGERFGGAMWFVLPNMIAGATLALCVCFSKRVSCLLPARCEKCAFNTVLIVLILGLMAAFHKNYMIFSAHNAFLMLPVCLGAYYLRKYAGTNLSKYLNYYLALLFACLIFVLVKYKGFQVELSANINPGLFWLYVLSFLGIYTCMVISKIIEKIPYLNGFVAFLGKNSFAIMALHFVMFKMVDRVYCLIIGETNPEVIGKWVTSYPEKLWWVYLIAGTVLPAIFGYAMSLIKKKSAKMLEKNRV